MQERLCTCSRLASATAALTTMLLAQALLAQGNSPRKLAPGPDACAGPPTRSPIPRRSGERIGSGASRADSLNRTRATPRDVDQLASLFRGLCCVRDRRELGHAETTVAIDVQPRIRLLELARELAF